MNSRVPTDLVPNRPWASHITRLRSRRVVLALSETMPDGVDRRQIQHVEVHRGHIRQPGFAIFEGAVPARFACGGTRKELVPGREPRLRSIDLHRKLARITCGK